MGVCNEVVGREAHENKIIYFGQIHNFKPMQHKKRLVVLSGAGVSAESGLQTFRDSDGLWNNYRIEEVATPGAFARDPKLVLDFYNMRRNEVAKAKPNAAHFGLVDLEKDFNVYVEYVSPRFSNANEAYKYLDIATISDVDGIITYVPRLEAYSHRIDLADEKKIPVITIDSDASSSKRQVYIGSNSYNFGKEAAKLVYESTAGIAKIAVISNEDIGNDTIEYDLKMRGFIDFLKEQPRMKIEKVYTSQMGVISAEEITQDIISNHPDVNAILTLSASDTLGSARLIVDRNRVGKIKLVGTGSSDKINDYINKGIIHSTIESDGYSMGYKSIETMININKGLYSPTYIYTQINIQKQRR